MRASWTWRLAWLPAAILLIPACDGGGSGSGSESGSGTVQVSDFHLVDTNTHSKTHHDTVSPRDFVGLAPAFYFGHAN